MKQTKIISVVAAMILIGIGAYFLISKNTAVAPTTPTPTPTPVVGNFDGKNSTFTINGTTVTLKNGVAQTPAAPGSASTITTRYFGNEATGDLNGDGTKDTAFLVTQDGGGSGTFYYAVVAVQTPTGYKTTNAFPIGDRIAPQSTEIHSDSGELHVNFAERNPGEPMTTPPSVGAVTLLRVTPTDTLTGLMSPDPAAPTTSGITGTVLLGPTCGVMKNPPDPQCADKPYATSLAITLADSGRVITIVNSNAAGTFKTNLAPGTYAVRSATASTGPFGRCTSDSPIVVQANAFTAATIYCDTGIR